MSQNDTKNIDTGGTAPDNTGRNTSGRHTGRFNLVGHIREEWKATVFVAACVTIAHLGFNWLDAVDSYTFLAFSNLVSHTKDSATAPKELPADSVVVVRIDEQTFRTRYRERSPLDRCVLSSQLSAIYAAQPHIVVVDLDLSPADWTRHESGTDAARERACQERLEMTLARAVDEHIRTVTMEPLDSFDPAVATSNAEWQQEQERAGIRFGDAALPVSYGMTLDHFSGDRTLYAAAERASVTGEIANDATAASRHRIRIDARAYTAKLQPILTSWTDTPVAGKAGYTDTDLTATLQSLLPAPAHDNTRNRIVFFGAGYGQEDTYLTPVGNLYGVEVHAAAFVSREPSRWCHLIALAIEIVIAFVFGMIIVSCWTHYFAWRLDDRSMYGQLASVWVAIMLVGLLVAIAAASAISSLLLGRFGMWLSPIPVAAGMLIESCMAGSVEAAVRRLHQIQSGLAPRVPSSDSILTLLAGLKATVWVLALLGALRLTMSH